MTEEQRRWVEYNKKALTRPFRPHLRLGRPAGCIRGPIYDFVTLDVFDKAVLAVIACNTLFLLTDHYDRSPTYDAVAVGLEIAFGVVYIAEAALKIVGFGPRAYFGDRSNLFDFFIVLAVIAGFILVLAEPRRGSSGWAEILSALQALRALRILRLMERVPVLRPLVGTLITTLWPLVNIAGLVFLTIFVYAILGMQLFGELDPADLATDYQFLGSHVNFLTFPNAFYALFVMSTGESWNAIGRELWNCSAVAPYFVLSFVLIVQLFLLSLFVAVILAAFTHHFESKTRGGVKKTLDDAALINYNTTWNMLHMDYVAVLRRQVGHERKRALGERRASATLGLGLAERSASAAGAGSSAELEELERQLRDALRHPYFLPAASFAELILRLKAPLGFRKRSRKARFTYGDVLRYVQVGHVPVAEGGQIHFHATLRALIDINVLQNKENKVPKEVEQLLQLKLASYARPAVARADQLSEEDEDDTSLMSILAREQIRRLIRRHSLMWRMRQLKKNGASEVTIRQFLATYDAVYGDGGQPRRSDLRLGAGLSSFSPGSARQVFLDRMRSMRSFSKR